MQKPEFETKTTYEFLPYTVDDVEETMNMWADSWRDTYPNEEYGVSKDWVEQRLAEKLSPDNIQRTKERIISNEGDEDRFSMIAKDDLGKIVGLIFGHRENGKQFLGALYTAAETHGTGLASQMMSNFFGWTDLDKPTYLGVAKYNERAKKFYEKMGFVEVPNSEHLFDDVIPEITFVKESSV